ncbi:MAG: 50S ribosomal protein L6 [Bacteroidetes bacterium ADurb.Bin408]|nr:MAG: 50S ribosomal protein L6 [Bacteroidetes bacterium ADurb.Bin408]
MSRIGKLPIELPKGVKINVSDKNLVTVEGPLGKLQQQIDSAITIESDSNNVYVKRHTELKKHKAMHGLYRALIANMITGVSNGYTIEQELVGVGYKATNTSKNQLELTLGYSHNIIMILPQEVNVETITERGKNPRIILKSIDKQLIGMVASKIRSLRAPEPYKGKGIKFVNEVLRRKAGKSAAAK